MASTSPARTRATASWPASPAIFPAASGARERGAAPPSPSTVTSASSGPSASALATTSGPMPRGSPGVTARRGRGPREGATPLESDVDVGRAAQQVEVVFHGELLSQPLADAILHLVERQLALGESPDQLEHDEARTRAPGAHLEDGLQPGDGVGADDLLVIRRELRPGQRVRGLGPVRVSVQPGHLFARLSPRPRG